MCCSKCQGRPRTSLEPGVGTSAPRPKQELLATKWRLEFSLTLPAWPSRHNAALYLAQLVIWAHGASSLRFGSTSMCTPTHPSRSTDSSAANRQLSTTCPLPLHDDAELLIGTGGNERDVLEPGSKGVRQAVWSVGGDHCLSAARRPDAAGCHVLVGGLEELRPGHAAEDAGLSRCRARSGPTS
jgi:hypothetical protein